MAPERSARNVLVTGRRSPGRPRSEAAREASLAAAVSILEKGGPRALTMEAIAAQAKVSKATLYRWWNSAAEVAFEGFLAAAVATPPDAERTNLSCPEELAEKVAALVSLS